MDNPILTQLHDRFQKDYPKVKKIIAIQIGLITALILYFFFIPTKWGQIYIGSKYEGTGILLFGLLGALLNNYKRKTIPDYKQKMKGTLYRRVFYPLVAVLVTTAILVPFFTITTSIPKAIQDFGYPVAQAHYFPFTVKQSEGEMNFETRELHLHYSVSSFQAPWLDVWISREHPKPLKGKKITLKNGIHATLYYHNEDPHPILVWYNKGLRYEIELIKDDTPYLSSEIIKVANSFY